MTLGVRGFFLLFLLLSFFAGCTPGDVGPRETLIYGRAADSIHLDPALINDTESTRVSEQIFEGLVRYKEETTEVEPALAVSWETRDNGLTWVFHLRKGVLFHDGTPFDSESVRVSFERQLKKGHPLAPEQRSPYADFALGMISEIETPDHDTILFRLKYPYAPFLFNLAMASSSPIVSPEGLKKYGRSFSEHPVGTGPFVLESWKKNDEIVLRRNGSYWDEKPKIKRLVFKVIPSKEDRVRYLLTAKADLIDGIPPEEIEPLKQSPQIRLVAEPGMSLNYLGFRCNRKPFNRKDVRIAVHSAIDSKALVASLYGGGALPANSPLPPKFFGYNGDLPYVTYSPEKARLLLKKAGYPHGFHTEIWCYDNPRPYNLVGKRLAEEISRYLSKVGIRTRIIENNWNDYLKAVNEGKGDLFLLGWIGDNGDPDNFLYILFNSSQIKTSQNLFYFSNPAVDGVLQKARETANLRERSRLYYEAQNLLYKERPCAFLSYGMDLLAHRTDLFGVRLNPAGRLRLQRVSKM
ncbi:MAG: ABC transporter substrate-binding protein [Armatimonadetes bacterium]|nr:ABC transporter substrate-binding protein [Armatimonadota bacterium]